ncbi:MAG TPA: glutaminyl-peptide cyclotransferase [Rhodanobacteraceae bacterium]|nr:glutaminyl-peptide cyclotransferase [Rhodanobacteraceae bacterium]
MKHALLALLLTLAASAPVRAGDVPVYGYNVVKSYPHDTGAYTEGLFWLDGHLYESTGEIGQSSIRKVDLKTGEVVQIKRLPPPYYGEGIVAWKDKLYELTWRNGTGFIYDLKSFKKLGQFHYPGEGWALTRDDTHLYMSDGSGTIRILDPKTLRQTGSIAVTWDGHAVGNLNELEWVDGEIYANIWLTNRIARIDPASGHIVGFIDLSGLAPTDSRDPANDVLNGIAWDAKGKRLFVTGKRWPRLYEIRLTQPKPP